MIRWQDMRREDIVAEVCMGGDGEGLVQIAEGSSATEVPCVLSRPIKVLICFVYA